MPSVFTSGRVNVDDTGLTINDVLAHHPVNAITGALVTRDEMEEIYLKTSFEDRILLPDRLQATGEDLLKVTNLSIRAN